MIDRPSPHLVSQCVLLSIYLPPPHQQVSICQACGLSAINRLERSRRYLVWTKAPLTDGQALSFVGA